MFSPRIGSRGTAKYAFAELFPLPGPAVIGATGDNSYQTLYGRDWVVVFTRERRLQLYQRQESGSWTRVLANLPTALFGPALPKDVRRITACFDQSARIIVAYEQGGVIKVTRWDSTTSQYVQNVSFNGVDPQLFMDATVGDPKGFPDGMDVLAAAGIRILFEWLPDSEWRENAIPDSDVVIFYLTPDRLGVRARAQRQLYNVVHEIYDYLEPVVLDRAAAIFGKYQLLLSDAAGDKLADALVSDAYIGDLLVAPAATELLPTELLLEAVRAENDTFGYVENEQLQAELIVENIAVIGDLFIYEAEDNELDAVLVVEDTIEVVGSVYPHTSDPDAMDAAVGVEDEIPVNTDAVFNTPDPNAIDGGINLESIRVQTI